MSTLNDVVINKLSGGLGRRMPEQDMVSGLLFDAAATPKLVLDTVYRLASLEDAAAYGINQDFDKTGQSAYYQIEQYFRMNPSGDLFIMATTATSYKEVVAKAKVMQEKANGAIRQMAIIFSGATDFAETIKAVEEAKSQTEQAYSLYMPFEIFLEGKGFDVNAANPLNLEEKNAESVSVVVAMDVEKGAIENYKNTAAVGVFLGAVSKAKVSENVGWIEKFNLTGKGFAKAGFVGGKVATSQGTLSTLNDSRYVFAKTHTGIAGIYFNDSHTCSLVTSDYAYVENNRAINKATRLLRTALLPKLSSPVLVDIDGTLPQSVSKSFEGLCRAALEGMVANQEISSFDVYVNPKQNILASSELKIEADIIPVGTARKIRVDLGFKNPFGIDKK
ncbi:MAG: DUF2586 domain-containing protein [Limnohabitans sp.]|nr:DUF2586 domain-containing protein [Limnohabitans sp.]